MKSIITRNVRDTHLVLVLLSRLIVAVEGSGLGTIATLDLGVQILEHFLLGWRNIFLSERKPFFHPLDVAVKGAEKREFLNARQSIKYLLVFSLDEKNALDGK